MYIYIYIHYLLDLSTFLHIFIICMYVCMYVYIHIIKISRKVDKSNTSPQVKSPYDFYKVLTFKWHVKKIEPNQIISLQITVI